MHTGCLRRNDRPLGAITGGIFHVTMSHVLYPVTKEVPHRVFDVYGAKKEVTLSRRQHMLRPHPVLVMS